MKKYALAAAFLFITVMALNAVAADEPKAAPQGAKALFFSGEGTTMSRTTAPRPAQVPVTAGVPAPVTPKPVKYMGVTYWVDRMGKNGEMKRVTSSTVFRRGDRIRVSLKSNRDGYLYVINQGSTGTSTMLFPGPRTSEGSNRITANQTYEIPPNGFFRFDENPGTETLMVMVSPSPMGTGPQAPFTPPGQMNASTPSAVPPAPEVQQAGLNEPPLLPPPPQNPSQYPPQYPPAQPAGMIEPPPVQTGAVDPNAMAGMQGGGPGRNDRLGPPPPPPRVMVVSREGGLTGVPRGAKDLTIDEITVAAKTNSVGTKDLVMEEDRTGPTPASYAVAPMAAMEGEGEGKMISLTIKLKHR